MSSGKQFFLAKRGQTFGPFNEAQIERFRESGEYETYTWFWDSDRAGWEAIDPAPAAPITAAKSRAHDASPSISNEKAAALHAVCYDHHTVLSGRLQNVTDGGCEFVCESAAASSPVFAPKVPIYINLLDSKSGRSMSVSARVSEVVRRNGQWRYRLNWKRCPELIDRQQQPSAAA